MRESRPVKGANGTEQLRRSAVAAVAGLLHTPITRRARREFLFCLWGLVLGVPGPLAWLFLTLGSVRLLHILHWGAIGKPRWSLLDAAVIAAVLVGPLVASGAARRLGLGWRALATRFLDESFAPVPPPDATGFSAALNDGTNWRVMGYLLLKLPVGALEGYAAFFWVGGLFNLTYLLWWPPLNAEHPTTVPVYTPIGWLGQGTFRVDSLSGAFEAFAVGAAMVLTAPWATKAVALADVWLIRRLLSPGELAQRVTELDRARALAVDDSVMTLRRLERDLHDGAQIRLATLAMNLGMAKRKLGDSGDPGDVESTRELLDAARQSAKDALVELRALVQGIHPPVLDNGLADALATLATSSAIPVDLTVNLPVRPTAAIETVAYFCTAELLANAAKHSKANAITINVRGSNRLLTLKVSDDGCGGADQAGGSGLLGLEQRISTVNGGLDISSPSGGPTQVTVTLPLRA
jgi:signal transduction histidine kinase